MELNNELERLSKYTPIDRELIRAEKLHPKYPSDMFRQVAILNEEAGEVTKAVLHYHYEGGSLDDVRDELIQTGAMVMRMLKNLDSHKEPQKSDELVELFKEIQKWSDKYEFSFQFWGADMNTVYIMKDQVELTSFGGCRTMNEVIILALNYVRRINGKQALKEKG